MKSYKIFNVESTNILKSNNLNEYEGYFLQDRWNEEFNSKKEALKYAKEHCKYCNIIILKTYRFNDL